MGAPVENVFIAWSGEQSKAVGKALFKWLPRVVQRVKPFMSEAIDSGARWREEVNRRLDALQIGVICMTPENLKAPWLFFEAGALSRLDQSRVTPYLVGVRSGDLIEPIPMFQAVIADRDGTLKMVKSINKAMDEQVEEADLEAVFDNMWPKLEPELEKARHASPPLPRKKADDVLEEILAQVRDIGRRLPADSSTAEDELLAQITANMDPEELAAAQRAANIAKGLGFVPKPQRKALSEMIRVQRVFQQESIKKENPGKTEEKD